MSMCIQNLVKFCPLVLKILSGNEILRSIKGRNSVANYNPNLLSKSNSVSNLQNLRSIKGRLSIGSQDIERKRNFEINQGP